jgi:lysophospholipase L1-like esterase
MPIKVKNITKNILAIGLGLTIAFIISEITLRIWQPIEFRVKGNKILLPINKKYQIDNDKISKIDKKIIHTKNLLGFRGEDLPTNFADYLTIITVGGSTTECYYLGDNKTWTADLGNILKKSFNKIWINNAGLDGCSTFGHLVLLEDYLVKLKPKMLIFLVGINDVGLEDSLDLDDRITIARHRGPFNVPYIKKMLTKSETCYFAINLWRNWQARKMGVLHANLDLTKVSNVEVADSEFAKLIQLHKEKYLRGYRNRLLKLIKICVDNSIISIFVTQPSLYGKGFDDITGTNLEKMKYTNNLNGKAAWELLELYNDTLREVASSRGLLWVDLAREMPKSSIYYYDMHHFTNEGAQKVAQIIYQKLYPGIASRFKEYQIGSEH